MRFGSRWTAIFNDLIDFGVILIADTLTLLVVSDLECAGQLLGWQ